MSDTVTDTPEGTPAVPDKPLEPAPKVFDEAYVKSLRDEAAKYRNEKKDAVDAAVKAANDANAAELVARDGRIADLENELGAAWIELQKLYTTIEAKVPSEKVRAFTAILQGTDEASITESAKNSLELFGDLNARGPVPGFDPTQGFGGRKTDIPLNGDPILDAIVKAVGG